MIVTLKNWSQMLFWKVQESQQNMLSRSLKVKKLKLYAGFRDLIG